MFLYNRGYYGKTDGVNPHGVIINASLVHEPVISRRDGVYDHLEMFLFDPQFYLYSVNESDHEETYKKLATYPWFNESPPEFDSSEIKLNEWKKGLTIENCGLITYPNTNKEIKNRIKECLSFQEQLGVSKLIMPTPLINSREDQFTEQIKWIRLGLELKDKFELPLLATIALSDQALLNIPFEHNPVSQTILDFLPTIEGLDGYYIVVERRDSTVQVTEKEIARTLLEYSYVLGENNGKIVVVNFVDVLGLICLAVGATAFGGGSTNKERRLCFDDFRKGFGRRLPKFYSTNLLGDFYSEQDLNKILKARLIRHVINDKTIYSAPLIKALIQGSSASTVPQWEERQNNVTFATRHRIESLVAQANIINGINTNYDKIIYILDFLQDVEARIGYLNKRIEGLSEDGRHVAIWRSALEDFINYNNIQI